MAAAAPAAPRGATPAPDAAPAAQGAAKPTAPATAPMTAADRETDYRKRRMEREEAERKATFAAERDRQLAAACEDARSELRTLESGLRLARVNERGEREVIDETLAASRMETVRRTLQGVCKTGG